MRGCTLIGERHILATGIKQPAGRAIDREAARGQQRQRISHLQVEWQILHDVRVAVRELDDGRVSSDGKIVGNGIQTDGNAVGSIGRQDAVRRRHIQPRRRIDQRPGE